MSPCSSTKSLACSWAFPYSCLISSSSVKARMALLVVLIALEFDFCPCKKVTRMPRAPAVTIFWRFCSCFKQHSVDQRACKQKYDGQKRIRFFFQFPECFLILFYHYHFFNHFNWKGKSHHCTILSINVLQLILTKYSGTRDSSFRVVQSLSKSSNNWIPSKVSISEFCSIRAPIAFTDGARRVGSPWYQKDRF